MSDRVQGYVNAMVSKAPQWVGTWGLRVIRVLARGWLIERARVRRLRSRDVALQAQLFQAQLQASRMETDLRAELERVRTERDDLRSQLHHHPGWTEW